MSDQHVSIWSEVPGGTELLRWFGQPPRFGDAEILSLELRRKGRSVLRVHSWIIASTQPGVHIPARHVVVSFLLDEILDLQLDSFSDRNVIAGLTLRRAQDRPKRREKHPLDSRPSDVEIELEPCYGMNGFIRARAVALVFQPGEPDASRG